MLLFFEAQPESSKAKRSVQSLVDVIGTNMNPPDPPLKKGGNTVGSWIRKNSAGRQRTEFLQIQLPLERVTRIYVDC